MALAEAGIELYPGAEGNADACVEALLQGNLAYNPDTMCSHHHGEGHALRKPQLRRRQTRVCRKSLKQENLHGKDQN